MTPLEALKGVKSAWEVLTEGNYTPREIEEWLRKHMKPAIDAARAAIAKAEGK